MSAELDRVLAVVDAGLQRSDEFAMMGPDPSRCWRCTSRAPAEGSELCAPCRSFLLEEREPPSGEVAEYLRELIADGLVDRALYGDRTGEPMGIVADVARVRDALEALGRALFDVLEPIVDAVSRFLNAIDWTALGELLARIEEVSRDVTARRTLPRGDRRRGRPTTPPRDLRATEGPRALPRPRRKTP